MSEEGRCFDDVCRTLVAAGETSGDLGSMLHRLAALTHQRLKLRSALSSAMIYPALLLTVAFVAVGAMITVVLPRFAELFESLGVPLPATTRVLITLGDVLRDQWWMVLIGLVAAAVLGRMFVRHPAGRRVVDQTLLRVPKLGPIIRRFVTARIARLLGVLISAHVPLLEAIALTRRATAHTAYAELLADAEARVAEGEALSTTFSDPLLIDPTLHEAIRSGENAGHVGPCHPATRYRHPAIQHPTALPALPDKRSRQHQPGAGSP